jgi:hypothetical protein
MSHTFFSLREKYPSAAKGDEGLMGLQELDSKNPSPASLTYRFPIRLGLSSPEGRGMCHGSPASPTYRLPRRLACALPKQRESNVSWLLASPTFTDSRCATRSSPSGRSTRAKRRGMSHTFFSLREKYPSAAKGDEGLLGLQVGFEEPLTCLAGARLSSPGASIHGFYAAVRVVRACLMWSCQGQLVG